MIKKRLITELENKFDLKNRLIVKIAESDQDKVSCFQIRTKVFVLEQGVDANHEIDNFDDTCTHAIAMIDSEPIGTGRLIKLSPTEAQIGRMAILHEWRRFNIGTEILNLLENSAKSQYIHKIILHAQLYVQNFYEGNGYSATGEVFLDENIPHILMHKNI